MKEWKSILFSFRLDEPETDEGRKALRRMQTASWAALAVELAVGITAGIMAG